jgi:hypothetical protein
MFFDFVQVLLPGCSFLLILQLPRLGLKFQELFLDLNVVEFPLVNVETLVLLKFNIMTVQKMALRFDLVGFYILHAQKFIRDFKKFGITDLS